MTAAALTVDTLFAAMTKADILAFMLGVAEDVDLNTTAWQPGKPERTILAIVAQTLAARDTASLAMGKGGFLRTARGSWLTLLARDQYGVERIEATCATAEDAQQFTNSSGVAYPVDVGDLTVSNPTTKKTYRNASAGTIPAGGTVTLDLVAVEPGSASNSDVGEISNLVDALPGVTTTNLLALVGTDEQSDDSLVEDCLLSLGAVSPDGPRQAYEYVARRATRSDGSTVDVNRVRSYPDGATGDVVILLAGSSGPPAGTDVTIVDDAIQESACPLGITATVTACTGVAVAPTYTLYVPDTCLATDDELKAAVAAGLAGWLKTYPIGGRSSTPGGAGYLYADALAARISAAATFAAIAAAIEADPDATASDVLTRAATYDAFRCVLASPGNTALATTEVATLGTITPTITRVAQ